MKMEERWKQEQFSPKIINSKESWEKMIDGLIKFAENYMPTPEKERRIKHLKSLTYEEWQKKVDTLQPISEEKLTAMKNWLTQQPN